MSKPFFERVNDWIRESESSIVNFISAFAPWLAPIAPAFMTYYHAVNALEFPVAVAIPVAVVVEILGFSTVSTYIALWFSNRRNKAESKRAPVGLVVVAFSFYMALIIFANVLLDAFPGEKWALITVRALFTLQTVPAALIVAVRTQHRDLLAEFSKSKAETFQKVTEEQRKVTDNFPTDWRKVRKNFTEEQRAELVTMSTESICFKYGITDRTARNWRKNAKAELEKVTA